MKHQLSIPRGQETLTFEYMAGRHTFDSFVTQLRKRRRDRRLDQGRDRYPQRQRKASLMKDRVQHEAQKILCFACVSFAIVLLFAILDFAG